MEKRNKLFRKHCNYKQPEVREIFHAEFKNLSNKVVYETRKFKTSYYKTYFETNKSVIASIWKSIKQLINQILPTKGTKILPPQKNC